MSRHDTARLDGIPRKSLSMRGETVSLRGEGVRKPLSDEAMKHAIGVAIERALESAGITKQAVSYAMGYGENQTAISKWIAGVETPQFARLFGVKELRVPLVIALAELADGIEITTQLTIRRRA